MQGTFQQIVRTKQYQGKYLQYYYTLGLSHQTRYKSSNSGRAHCESLKLWRHFSANKACLLACVETLSFHSSL